jgi:cytochrome P450
MASLEGILFYAARIGTVPEWHPVLFFANIFLFPSMRGIMFFMDFVNKVVGPRLQAPLLPKNNTGPTDFISRFRHLQSENPEKVRDKDIIASALATIGAGSDTTGISLTAVFYFLSRNKEVLGKVRSELEEAKSCGEISSPITFKEAQQLKYLQAVLKEALRCHPATGLILGRIVPKGGCTLAGHFFPGGVCVARKTH